MGLDGPLAADGSGLCLPRGLGFRAFGAFRVLRVRRVFRSLGV